MDTDADKHLLIQQLGSGDRDLAHGAIKVLRRRGWLENGALNGVYLHGANLSDLNLIGANLKNAVLSGADLSHTRLVRADLSGANLSGSNLREVNLHQANAIHADFMSADLSYANLSGANLLRANLYRASLYRANLEETTLQESNLSRTILQDANLCQANLNHTNMSYTNLHRANLTRTFLHAADLSNAQCAGTNFADTDLFSAVGLETVHHDGPSHLAVDTLYHSWGQVPEVFLRGCGLPEEMIAYLPNLMGRASEFYSCFISYSHADKAFARRIHDTLQAQGVRCWLDEKQMNPGDDIYEEINRGIRLWDKVLLCCSRSSLAEKWWVDHEMDVAFQKERELFKTRGEKVLALIPLDLDGYLFSPEFTSGKAQQIRSRVAATFHGWEQNKAAFDREIERVIRALKTDGGKERPPTPRL